MDPQQCTDNEVELLLTITLQFKEWHQKIASNQKKKAKIPVFLIYMQLFYGFWKSSPWKEFSKNYVFSELKICLSVDQKADRIEKARF